MPRIAAEMDAVTSPSWISLMRAPASRISAIRSWCRGRSRTIVVTSPTRRPNASAIASMFSATGRLRSILPRGVGPDGHLAHVHVRQSRERARGRRTRSSTSRRLPRARRCRRPRAGRARGRSAPRRLRSACPAPRRSAPSAAPITMWPSIGSCSSASSIPANAASCAAVLVGAPEPARARQRRTLGHPRVALAQAGRPRGLLLLGNGFDGLRHSDSL